MKNYREYFFEATGNEPFGYQCRLACGPDVRFEDLGSLEGGTACRSQLINIPTGLGKTAAVVLAWLWNRMHFTESKWPRRLVYCLPMRTLVEQTEKNVRSWLEKLGLDGSVGVHVLMGGEDDGNWDIYPEKPAILIGTQDMLLSRALNRGYGMSRYRWPMHFGLLNNDCLWVMDETQLMGPGLSTACQLEAFRNPPAQGFGSISAASSVTWYMSATGNPDRLKTREWRNVSRPAGFEFGLTAEEKAETCGLVHQRRFAVKRLELESDSRFVEEPAAESLVAAILNRHMEMVAAIGGDTELTLRTLIICNTVDRAVAVHRLLSYKKPDNCDLLLLHSRFRPPERRNQVVRLVPIDRNAFPKGQIVVSTQVIEAGVDVSSGILWSEIAPLASLVQRLGRLNRAGEFNSSPWEPKAFIVGAGLESAPPRENKDEARKREEKNVVRCLPYELRACESAWDSLKKLNYDASPANLEQIREDVAASIPGCPYSLQRHELTDFFDTDANLSLGYTDVSPFVRGLDNDTDLQVFWRENWLQNDGEQGTSEPGLAPDFQRDELCPVTISKARDPKARDVLYHGWVWRGKDSGWVSVRDAGIAPGMTILLPLKAGGYNNTAGWTGNKDDNKHSSHYQIQSQPTDEELLSLVENGWRSIAEHTAEVGDKITVVLNEMFSGMGTDQAGTALLEAVLWHDVGKSHPEWQHAVLAALEKAGITGKQEFRPFAKFSLSESPLLRNEDGSIRLSGDALKQEIKRLCNAFRPGISHEVASALAFRQNEQQRLGANRDLDLASLLAEYIIMSHHGRVRKVLRDELPKYPKDEKDTNTVRGISDGDPLPAVVIDGQSLGANALSTDCRRMGRDANGHESYTRGVLRLLAHYGPFRLAFFEAIFRAADIRASIVASGKHNT